MNEKFWTAAVLFLTLLAIFSCGGSAKLYIYTPIDGTGNPFDGMKPNEETAGIYFRFQELREGYNDMFDVNPVAGDVWYPVESGMGINPFQSSFDLDGASIDESKVYRVEIWGKNNFASASYDWYGWPDCPLIVSKGTRVNICFGTYFENSTFAQCSEMRQNINECQR